MSTITNEQVREAILARTCRIARAGPSSTVPNVVTKECSSDEVLKEPKMPRFPTLSGKGRSYCEAFAAEVVTKSTEDAKAIAKSKLIRTVSSWTRVRKMAKFCIIFAKDAVRQPPGQSGLQKYSRVPCSMLKHGRTDSMNMCVDALCSRWEVRPTRQSVPRAGISEVYLFPNVRHKDTFKAMEISDAFSLAAVGVTNCMEQPPCRAMLVFRRAESFGNLLWEGNPKENANGHLHGRGLLAS